MMIISGNLRSGANDDKVMDIFTLMFWSSWFICISRKFQLEVVRYKVVLLRVVSQLSAWDYI